MTTTQSRLFDVYVMVDWSGGSRPSRGKNSIWIAWGEWCEDQIQVTSENISTRAEAVERIVTLCGENPEKRILIGLDFAFGYPKGFASQAGLPSSSTESWKAIHRYFGATVVDGNDNKHNLFEVAQRLNRAIGSDGPGPFWGCPEAKQSSHLTMRRKPHFAWPYSGLAEWRLTEERAKEKATAQSVWKLFCGVSVGGQTIVGLHRLQQLRDHLKNRIQVWPFETGWQVPSAIDTIVVAEIFPSLTRMRVEPGIEIKDERQVRSCVYDAAERDQDCRLIRAFERPTDLCESQEHAVRNEEGWILFVD